MLEFDGWPWKTIGHLFYTISSFVHNFIAISELKLSGNAQFGLKSVIFLSHVTLKFDRWPWKCCFRLCASFHSRQSIQTGVTVQKRSIPVKIGNFLSCVIFKFDRWPWKTIRHFFYAASSFAHHFIAISLYKLELQSGNAKFGSKSGIFFVPCDLEIWQMTLKNNKAPLLCYFKLCASFQSHGWIQTGVTVRKCPIWVKIDNFFSRVTLKFDGWPWKTIGNLF